MGALVHGAKQVGDRRGEQLWKACGVNGVVQAQRREKTGLEGNTALNHKMQPCYRNR